MSTCLAVFDPLAVPLLSCNGPWPRVWGGVGRSTGACWDPQLWIALSEPKVHMMIWRISGNFKVVNYLWKLWVFLEQVNFMECMVSGIVRWDGLIGRFHVVLVRWCFPMLLLCHDSSSLNILNWQSLTKNKQTLAGENIPKWEFLINLESDVCYDCVAGIQMSHHLFGSQTGSLNAHKSEQMKVKFWGCFFSLMFIFFPSSALLVIPTECLNTESST